MLVSQPPICTNCGGLLTNTPKIFGFVAFCFLPFFVLAAWVKPTFVKYGSDTKPAHAAIIGGLLGVLIAYALFAYAGFLLGFGVFWIFFLFWIGGLVLALLGLKVGPKFVRHASGA